MHRWLSTLILASVPIASMVAHGACLTTLGTDDCFRAGDPRVQAIEHLYLDTHARVPPSRRRPRVKHTLRVP